MQVNTSNDIKIYNLSAGKSLPDWISGRKRRQAEKTDASLRRRIQIFQDFDMPEVSHCIKISPDGQFVVAAGAYKPRVRCFDTNEMSMKFERCMDSEIVDFLILSEDYTKMVFLHSDRYLELHAQYGKYYRVRIPKFGRDMTYQSANCNLCIVGASRDVYRLNLEDGCFLPSLTSSLNTELNTCDTNPVHQLLVTGTTNGHIESWDPRSGKSEGILYCGFPDIISDLPAETPFAITKVKFKDALNLAVGTSSGHILLYDIRCQKPYSVKDHNYSLPIKDIEFIPNLDYVASIDSKIVKIWEREGGKTVTSVEPGTNLNDLCFVPETGMFFLANEAPKISTYFIPSLGPAPSWCGFLDNLTEELEETAENGIYDDYKFLTVDELENLGLSDLIGTNLLRAYMHGFFVDLRLYKKAKSIVEPFNYDEYRKQKIQDKINTELLEPRIKTTKLPKINTTLAKKYLEISTDDKNKKKSKLTGNANPLNDERFSSLFKNPDFQVDPTSEEYRLLNPVVSKLDKRREKNVESDEELEEIETGLAEIAEEGRQEGRQESVDESSDDEDRERVNERRRLEKIRRDEKRSKLNRISNLSGKTGRVVKMDNLKSRSQNFSLGRRLRDETFDGGNEIRLPGGNRQMTFASKSFEKNSKMKEKSVKHHAERRQLHRSGQSIESRLKKPWIKKRK